MIKRVSILTLTLVLAALWAAPGAADVYWEELRVTKRPGRKAKTEVLRHYFTPQRSRVDLGENVVIADFTTMTGYVLNTDARQYLRINMHNVGHLPEDLKRGVTVTPTGQKKKIAGYLCRKYKIRLVNHEYEQWISKQVKGYQELKTINDRLTPILQQHPLFQSGVVGRMHMMDGFPVRTVRRAGDTVRITTLRTVKQVPIDPEVFQVPPGYQPPY